MKLSKLERERLINNESDFDAFLAEVRASGVDELNDTLCKLLPGCQYMDPPDGGSVTPLEQVSRMVAGYREQIQAAEKRIAVLGRYLKCAHAFIENTEAFGHEAASGILKCGDSEWNVDASKESLAAAGITVKGE